jgi:polar amino acid transport system substrate-binding protein
MHWLFSLIVIGFLVACSPQELAEKELIVGMDLSYPPFETIDERGEPQGVSVELAGALAEYLGRPLRIENIPFVGLIPSLKSGRVDFVISSMTLTAERAESIDFSEPYLRTGLALLVGAGSDVNGLKDLDQAGRKVVVRQGTTGEVWARGTLSHAEILAVEKENAAVLEVLQGGADAFVYDQMSVWTNNAKHPERSRALLNPVKIEEWAIGIRKGNTKLRDQANAFLKQFREQGGFESLGEKYLPEQKEAFEKAGIPFVF